MTHWRNLPTDVWDNLVKWFCFCEYHILLLVEILRLPQESKHSYFLFIYSSHLGRLSKKTWEVDRQNSFPPHLQTGILKYFSTFIPNATWQKIEKGNSYHTLAIVKTDFTTSWKNEFEWTNGVVDFQPFSVNPLQNWKVCCQNPFGKPQRQEDDCFRPSPLWSLSGRDTRVKDVSPARCHPHEQEGQGVAQEGDHFVW